MHEAVDRRRVTGSATDGGLEPVEENDVR